METFDIRAANQQPDVVSQLFNEGFQSQYALTTEEMCHAIENSDVHTCENIVQIILEERRRVRRETLSQKVRTAMKNRTNKN